MPLSLLIDNIKVQIAHIDSDGQPNPLPIVIYEDEGNGIINRISLTKRAAAILAEELATYISEEELDDMAKRDREAGLVNVESMHPADTDCFAAVNNKEEN